MKENKSIYVARAMILIFAAALLIMLGAAPVVVRWYVGLRGMRPQTLVVILVCWYACSVPAAIALWRLWVLLRRIGSGEPFVDRNIRDIRHVSDCAQACAVICGGGAVGYAPFLVVSAAMLFLFAIVQVVAACFRAAMELADENSLTI